MIIPAALEAGKSRTTISWHDILARGNIDEGADGFGEFSGDAILWSAGNEQLFQVFVLNPLLKRT